MKEKYVSFQLFNSVDSAKEVEQLLKEKGIKTILKDTPSTFDAALGISTKHESELFVPASELQKAKEVMNTMIDSQVIDVDKEHYLFGFTNEELYEVILKEEEWSRFDVQLAGNILKERGIEEPDELYEPLIESKRKEFSEHTKASIAYLFFGYFFSIARGIIGGGMGANLYHSKNELPNGEKI